ncbi:MAG: aminotransferase class I/II-fold pyridoxal phosphate-dependent enzyme, partial [Anaerotruncus sp.]|nr:aminotransferase class I/II-fold pyridoxal phosphate-dependent enzyme [Anaerotruncus sp.]
MPGHKRNPKFNIIGSEEDITEIEGFDNLHYATGSIKEIEDCLSEFYSSKRSFLLVNGSTVGLLSAIFAVTDDGDKIIIARNCHKSVYSACLLRHLNVIYAEPDYDELHGIYTRITQEEIDRLTKQHPNAKAIVVTTPTYEGITSNITANIPIIADGAHAAH